MGIFLYDMIGESMKLNEKQIAAMAIAAIAEEMDEDIDNLRVVSFKEVQKSSLEKYLEEHQIIFNKYQLGDESK